MHTRTHAGTALCSSNDANVEDLALWSPSVRHPALREAVDELGANRNEAAERTLLRFLDRHPDSVDGLYLMAEAVARAGRLADAERLLARTIEREPAFNAARFAYAKVLYQQGKWHLSEKQLEALSLNDPRNTQHLHLQALVLATLGKHDAGLDCCRKLVEREPESGEVQIRYGHALRAMGLRDECILVYRGAIKSFPARGDAYWGLASLKVFRFTNAEINAMQDLLNRSDLTSENRAYLHFALGRALGDLAQWGKSFENYARGNAISRINVAYDPQDVTERASAIGKKFTRAWLEVHAGGGCASREPIFVLGMQRSGSTLVEQILASHPAIEGMGELPEYPLASCQADSGTPGRDNRDMMDHANFVDLRRSGERYLENVRRRRKFADRPYFVDKQPYNFWHIGLMHLMLPNAKIIDVRREPMACCFSNFATLLSHEHGFNHRLSDLGHYYRDYTELMAHFDRVLPGKIHRVSYERLIAEPEAEIRRLFEYLGLDLEEGCLRFYECDRPLDSASSEQVRMPIFTEAAGYWRNYEAWLGPLKDALGSSLES